ncbi:MAG: outer membrane beta-barrel domain-containing protein [Bradymonadales bacterium]|jgi:outer membrane beta-barrel protein
MRRIVSLVVFALLLLAMPEFVLAQDSSVPEDAEGTDSMDRDDDDEAQQSRIVVRSQKKKREFSDKIVVIQRKPFMRRNRVELSPMFFGSINDSLLFQLGAGLNVNYHILEWLYVGATGAWQDWRFVSRDSNGLSSAYNDVVDATDAIPTTSIVNGYVGGVVGFVPVYGKFFIFNTAVVHWDFSLGIGGGAVHSRANGFLGAGMITVDHRWYFLKWLSLNFNVRGWVYYEDVSSRKGVYTHWQAGIGIGFWLPPSWEYKSDW